MKGGESKPKKAVKHSSLRMRLFVSFTIFVMIIFAALWFFQIRMMGYFYQRERFKELNGVADKLSERITAPDFDDYVDEQAVAADTCIMVFEVRENSVRLIANAEEAGNCVIHRLIDGELLERYYNSAKQNGGTYDERVELEYKPDEEDEDEIVVPGSHRKSESVSAVHARVLQREGREYLLLVNCELTPMDTTVRTLQVQFFWLAGILVIAAVLSITFLSRIISRPLIAVTEKARGLPKGNYEPDVSGSGYREIQELEEVLNYAATEIGATDKLQKELIANISHDLRTPLTMIKGYSEMMRDIPGENSPENVQVIIDETTRLSELVGDLMDLSKLQSGARKPELSVFDLTETVRDTMKRYDTLIRHEGYVIDTHLTDTATVRADRTMILQVVYNLINNAVNYTGEDKRITVTESFHDGFVRIAVSDSGDGIPPDKIHEIWDRYYRVDKVHKRAVMGTGLGLSIVKNVLEAHQAGYGVESTVGVGSVFWFELPLVDEDE
ncbi:MAG: HAMP domain-containing histidine kinase [Clostridia bacterium]|nr:HAMP domain-containing histidine kinase [Clostridia bacterium]